MVEEVDIRPRIRYDDGYRWRTHNGDLFPVSKHQADQTEKTPPHLSTFTVNDLFYLGFLVLSGQSTDMLASFGSPFDPQSRRQIEVYLNGSSGVNLEDYFEPKRKKNEIEAKVKRFANLTLEARQAFLAENPPAAPVLAPISRLTKEEMIFWHHITHNDHAARR